MVKILLIEDHSLVRAGMSQMLKEITDITIIGEAGTGHEGIQLAKRLHRDVIILDFKLPDISGLEVALKLFRINLNLKILILTAAINDLFPFRLFEVGIHEYLTKDTSKEELVHAIKTIYGGQRVISPEIASRLALAKIAPQSNSIFHSLTNREIEVMMMAIRGLSVKEIARNYF